MVEKYTVRVKCSNCKRVNLCSIIKGVTIMQHAKTVRCGYCGVTLSRVKGSND